MCIPINTCRICGNPNFETILDLGIQSLTGVFPKTKGEKITKGPLELIKCSTAARPDSCGLVQLRHTYDGNEMYGENYGYRSALNSSMVRHLKDIVTRNLEIVELQEGDLVIDIASNDGTLLKFYPKENVVLAGIDPTCSKFAKYYEGHIKIISDFFNVSIIEKEFNGKKAKIITSIAMFYDLEEPLKFVQDIYQVLADDGIWVFEQSYMPAMIEHMAYDTVCHEHIEYYGLKQVKWMLDKAGFKIIDLELNDTNGGSFKVIVSKQNSKYTECTETINLLLAKEQQFSSMEPFVYFRNGIIRHKSELIDCFSKFKKADLRIFGYGASTKGNVILQYCGITEEIMPFIADVNEDKFGCFTPGTEIPIISEKIAREMKPDCFVVLPWHFRENILMREQKYLNSGGKLIFPLPKIDIVEK